MANQIELKVEQLKSCIENENTDRATQVIADISGAFFNLVSNDEKGLLLSGVSFEMILDE